MGAATATLVGMGASALTKGISAGVQARRAAEEAEIQKLQAERAQMEEQAGQQVKAAIAVMSKLARNWK